MSWFEEQLNIRQAADNAEFEGALDSIANAVMGTHLRKALSQKEIAASAVDEILKYYKCVPKAEELPIQFGTVDEQIEYRIRPYGIKCRRVTLEKGWYHNAVGPLLGTLKEDGSAVALIPAGLSGYRFVNIKTGERKRLNGKNESLLDDEAVCFYEPFPQRALTMLDLLTFMVKQMRGADIVLYLSLMVLTSAVGLLSPLFTKWLFGDVLESESLQLLLALAVFMFSFSVCRILIDTFQGMVTARIEVKQTVAVRAAVMSRVMSLPPTFFRQFSAGELSQRTEYVQSLSSTLFNSIGITGLTSLFSLIYIGEIFAFAPSLLVPSLTITAITVILSLLTSYAQVKVSRKKMNLSAKRSGLMYATITGIKKIKLAGAEKRMFSRWARLYAEEAELEYNPPAFLKFGETIRLAVFLSGVMLLYTTAVKNHVSVADYYAFGAAYGIVSSAFLSFSAMAVTFANVKPTLEMARPIMEAAPEVHDGKENIVSLRGGIELSHVSFRYDETMPNVIDDLSLTIEPGEYLAVVGPTGCGKSTLIRLLLGFETPQKGSIFFDKKDITKIDLESLRRKIGSVMQDGQLFFGDIYSNIVITAPELGIDAAWEAAEIASVADDIRAMPMGMNTIISEGQGGISGGQKQRLMIARAVAPKPKILIFDEATSALDNITQKKVSDAIDSLECTRIVIAHRLSTVQNADRIVYLDGGRIIEDGSYEELIAKNGAFAKLVERQRPDAEG